MRQPVAARCRRVPIGLGVRTAILALEGAAFDITLDLRPYLRALAQSDGARWVRHFERLPGLMRRKPPGFEARASLVIHGMITDLFVDSAKTRSATRRPRQGTAATAQRKACRNLSGAPHRYISLKELVFSSGVSRSKLYPLFKKCLGLSPMAYLARYRIQHAQKLLEHTNLPIKEVSVQCGIEDVNYFSR